MPAWRKRQRSPTRPLRGISDGIRDVRDTAIRLLNATIADQDGTNEQAMHDKFSRRIEVAPNAWGPHHRRKRASRSR